MPKLIHVTTVPHTLHFLIGQISHMKQAGIEVEAISSVDAKLDIFLQQERVPHHEVTMERSLSPLRDLVACYKLWQIFRSRHPDMVHAHTPKAGLLAMLAAFFARVPIRIYHIHGLRCATLSGWKRQLVVACERLACRLATQILCVSQSAREAAVQYGLVPAERIKVLLNGSINGLDATGRFQPDALPMEAADETRRRLNIPTDATVIGFMGRLARDKGIEELCQAWQVVREKCSEAHLLLVGDYESQDPVCVATRCKLESDERIHRVAYDPDTPPLFAAMDVFCLPSYREGLPYVLLEASAMRLPVVATRVTGCVDAVEDGVTGTLVTVGDQKALAAAMLRYATDPVLRKWHGAAGRRRVLRDFRPEAMWAALLTEYQRELSACGCQPQPQTQPAPRTAARLVA